jgi:glyceraldehyde-3-phosphate dehydrogenase (NADP+)
MGEQKTEVVKTLTWEGGKSLQDSEKEFNRTIIYLKNTIPSLA